MRGTDEQTSHMFSCLSPEQRVPTNHPLRSIPTTFTKNRDRLLDGDVARAFFDDVVAQARGQRLLSDEHFTVDGTLLEAWAGQKSFRRKGQRPNTPDDPGNPAVDFHGERRLNDTHESTTDPDARLFKNGKGKEAKLSYLGEVLMDNREGLIVDACVVRRPSQLAVPFHGSGLQPRAIAKSAAAGRLTGRDASIASSSGDYLTIDGDFGCI